MKLLLLPLLFLLLNLLSIAQDKEVFSLLEKGNIESLTLKIETLETKKNKDNLTKAYYGALVSKKAELFKSPKKKLSVFKEGVQYLEDAIIKDSENSEIRFLRYIIQVKSPSFLSYNKNISEDKLFIESSDIRKELKLQIESFNQTCVKHKINLQ